MPKSGVFTSGTKLNRSAFSLIEIMIALVVSGILLVISVNGILSMGAKNRHRKSTQNMELAIRRAKSEARGRSLWTCLRFSNDGQIRVYADSDGNHGLTGGCGNSGDPLLLTIHEGLAKGNTLAACTGSVALGCRVWFNTEGNPMLCSNSGNCGQSLAANPDGSAYCIPYDYQIIIRSTELPSLARAREIEILRSGLIFTPVWGDKGQIETLWASVPPITSGSGACQ